MVKRIFFFNTWVFVVRKFQCFNYNTNFYIFFFTEIGFISSQKTEGQTNDV